MWLALSPWTCGYAEEQPAATCNAAFVGIALALVSHFHVSFESHFIDWLNFAAGIWLVAAPFALEFGATALPAANSIAVGTLVLVLATDALSLDKEVEKWWHKQVIGD